MLFYELSEVYGILPDELAERLPYPTFLQIAAARKVRSIRDAQQRKAKGKKH